MGKATSPVLAILIVMRTTAQFFTNRHVLFFQAAAFFFWMNAAPLPAAEPYSVAIFSQPSFEDRKRSLVSHLNASGFKTRVLTSSDFEDASVLNAPSLSCLILMNELPENAKAKDTIQSYLRAGGDFVAAGGSLATQLNADDLKIPLFDPTSYAVYSLKGTESISVFESGEKSENGKIFLRGAFSGTSAVGFNFPSASTFKPLLTARDSLGRALGWASGMLIHFAGPYSNGQWLAYGIDEPSFYGKEFQIATSDILKIFQSRKLLKKYSAEQKSYRDKLAAFQITSPKPGGFVKIKDGNFILPNGKKLFLVGANIGGPIDLPFIFGKEEEGTFDIDAMESVFRRARDCGVNCFRVFSAPSSGKVVDVLKHLSRKYGVYLYFCLSTGGKFQTESEVAAWYASYAKAYADEPMVLGYDLENEPFLQAIGGVAYGGEKLRGLRGMYEKFGSSLPSNSIDFIVKNGNGGFSKKATWLSETDKKDIAAVHVAWLKKVRDVISKDGTTTFPGYQGSLPTDPVFQEALDAVDKTFTSFIAVAKKAIREADPNHFITVGYNNELALLPANEALDFTSAHVYEWPESLDEHLKNLTTLDRLKKRFPTQPTFLGEFGYTSGYILKKDRATKTPISLASQALGEFTFYLYAFARGYAGTTVWMLDEIPASIGRYNMFWVSQWGIKQQRHGLFYYDGNPASQAAPKPLAHALRFFKRYTDLHETGSGKIEFSKIESQIGTAYVFKGDKAIYVGNVKSETPGLAFTSEEPVNVLLDWNSENLEICATSDVQVRIEPGRFDPKFSGGNWKISGSRRMDETSGDGLRLGLLAGETISISKISASK